MSSIESRVRSLERAWAAENQRWSERYERAEEALHRGTATMDQYRLVLQQQLRASRDERAQFAVILVAMARMGSETDAHNLWQLAVAYPPDAQLPKPIRDAIRRLQIDATSTATTDKQLRRSRFVTPGQFAARKFHAAAEMLVIGDLHGMEPDPVLRTRVVW
jgi:hypothetical protein